MLEFPGMNLPTSATPASLITMNDLTNHITWCLGGSTEERPVELRGLLSCIDYRERIVATREEICHALARLRAEGRVAGVGGRYFATEPGDRRPFAQPTVEEHEAAFRAYTAPIVGDERSLG